MWDQQDTPFLALQAFMGGLRGKDGFAEALQTGMALKQQRDAKVAQEQTQGLLGELLAGGRDYRALTARYPKASGGVLTTMLNEVLGQERAARERGDQRDYFKFQQDTIQRGQIEDEQRAREEAARTAQGAARLIDLLRPSKDWVPPSGDTLAMFMEDAQIPGASLAPATAQINKERDDLRLEQGAAAQAANAEARLELQARRLEAELAEAKLKAARGDAAADQFVTVYDAFRTTGTVAPEVAAANPEGMLKLRGILAADIGRTAGTREGIVRESVEQAQTGAAISRVLEQYAPKGNKTVPGLIASIRPGDMTVPQALGAEYQKLVDAEKTLRAAGRTAEADAVLAEGTQFMGVVKAALVKAQGGL